MGNIIDRVGQRHGKLLIIKRLIVKNSSCARWLCKCDCGKEVSVLSCNLGLGRGTNSCGCTRRKTLSLKPYEALYKSLIRNTKHEINLTYEEFVEFTKIKKCHYCNSEIKWAEFYTDKNGRAYNLDRKDNLIGYSKENCVVCCAKCNLGKGRIFTYEEWKIVGNALKSFYDRITC